MARNFAWQIDENLNNDMTLYVRQGLKRNEIIDFLNHDFPNYNNGETSIDAVRETVKKEISGLGKMLGYRALHKKIRQEHNLFVTRDAVYN